MENLFYVSFLIREGKAALYPNEENGLLTLCKMYLILLPVVL